MKLFRKIESLGWLAIYIRSYTLVWECVPEFNASEFFGGGGPYVARGDQLW